MLDVPAVAAVVVGVLLLDLSGSLLEACFVGVVADVVAVMEPISGCCCWLPFCAEADDAYAWLR